MSDRGLTFLSILGRNSKTVQYWEYTFTEKIFSTSFSLKDHTARYMILTGYY